MNEMPMNEQECQQDVMRRVHKWVTVLEERIIMLLQANDPESMKPGECEQAVSRHLMMLLRLLQLRQQYAQSRSLDDGQAILEALLGNSDE